MSRAVPAPPPASQNGHGLADALALRKAQHEAHRRAVVAAYLAIPDVLLDSLERVVKRPHHVLVGRRFARDGYRSPPALSPDGIA